MYELAQRIGVADLRRISTSHLRLVLPLHAPEQERLVRAAEDGAWSVRRLEEEVRSLTRRSPATRTARGGRSRHSPLRVAVRAVQNCTGALREFLAANDDEASPESTRCAVEALREATQVCARAERMLRPRLPGAETSPPPPVEMQAAGATPPRRGGPR
jgi:hypothetical protein